VVIRQEIQGRHPRAEFVLLSEEELRVGVETLDDWGIGVMTERCTGPLLDNHEDGPDTTIPTAGLRYRTDLPRHKAGIRP
jgi:hypothetical protein